MHFRQLDVTSSKEQIMPFTINGIGTTFSGRKNTFKYQGTCEFCGQQTMLTDYETLHCICVLFVPLIPLGRKRVIGECSLCNRSRVSKLKDWEAAVETTLTEKMRTMRENPQNLDAAIDLHKTFQESCKPGEATEIAKVIRERFSNSPKALFYLSNWYESIGDRREAHACVEKVYELDQGSNKAKQAMVVVHIDNGQMDRAEAMLKEMKQNGETFDSQLLVMLAQAYRDKGNQQRSNQIIEYLKKNDPQAARRVKFNRSTRKPVNQIELAQNTKHSLISRHPWLIGVAVVLLIIASISLSSFYIQGHRQVFVMNGLSKPIQVDIDGEQHSIPPLTNQEISVAEGEHQVKLVGPPEELPGRAPYDFKIESSFMGRLVDKTITVLDPSESAIYLKEVEFYSDDMNDDFFEKARNASQVYMFKKVTQFDDIDFPFEDLPQEIMVSDKSNKKVHERSALTFVEGVNGGALFLIRQLNSGKLKEEQIDAQVRQYIQRFLPAEEELGDAPLEPELGSLLNSYAQLIDENQIVYYEKMLEKWLIQTPDAYYWADIYLSMMQRLNQLDAGIAKLQEWGDKYPDNPTFKHMKAQSLQSLATDLEVYSTLFEQNPDQYLFSSAYRTALEGSKQYEKVLEVEQQAHAIRKQRYEEDAAQYEEVAESENTFKFPEESNSITTLTALMALGEQEKIDKIFTSSLRSNALSNDHISFRIRNLLNQDRLPELRDEMNSWIAGYHEEYGSDSDWIDIYPEATLLIWQKKYAEALELVQTGEYKIDYVDYLVELILLTRPDYQTELENLRKQLEEEDGEAYPSYQLFDIKLMEAIKLQSENKNDDAIAAIREYYENEFSDFTLDYKVKQALFAENLSWEELYDLPVSEAKRRLIFCYLGLKHDQLFIPVKEYLGDYYSTYTLGYHLVDTVLNEERKKPENTNPVPEPEVDEVTSDIDSPAKAERPADQPEVEPATAE
ncbi:MAG: hypothetical protein R3C11_27485 [Planctomycetaceae bacterium]